MKITVYTTTNCQFSKQEKEYLTSHNVPFDEKNLESNREYLTEMLTVGNNFAGTPVTKIEKNDDTIVVLKGFTQDEFDQALELAKPAAVPAPQPQSFQQPPQNTPTPPQPQPPMTEPTPPVPPMPTPEPVPPTTPQPPVQPTNPSPTPPTAANDPQLNALLSDLQSKANGSTPSSDVPSIPNPNF